MVFREPVPEMVWRGEEFRREMIVDRHDGQERVMLLRGVEADLRKELHGGFWIVRSASPGVEGILGDGVGRCWRNHLVSAGKDGGLRSYGKQPRQRQREETRRAAQKDGAARGGQSASGKEDSDEVV